MNYEKYGIGEREIKFRAWDKARSEMHYLELKHQIQSLQSFFNNIGVNDKVLMQYAGFTDENGKEIYEGDILRVSDEEGLVDNNIDSNTGIGVLCYLDDCGLWYIDNIENSLGEIMTFNYVEVIGNVFENPELIN